MKIQKASLIFVAFLLHASFVQAETVNGYCATEMAPTTSFVYESDERGVEMSVINHNGMAFAPFWFSPVVPNDMTLLSERAQFILKLDEVIAVKWKPEQCQFLGDSLFSCMGATEPLVINGLKIEPWATYSSTTVEKSFAGTFEFTEVAFRFYANGEGHTILMKYQKNECDLSREKKEKVVKKIKSILK